MLTRIISRVPFAHPLIAPPTWVSCFHHMEYAGWPRSNHLSSLIQFESNQIHSAFPSFKVRLGIFLVLLTAFVYAIVTLIDRLVLRRYHLPEIKAPSLDRSQSLVFGFKCFDTEEEETGSTILDLEEESLPRFGRTKRYLSPSPEDDEHLSFDRQLFYENLNNSSQYLRRDSFIS